MTDLSDFHIVIIGLVAFVAICVAFIAWGMAQLLAVHSINRPNPADELPPQSWRDRVRREQEGRG